MVTVSSIVKSLQWQKMRPDNSRTIMFLSTILSNLNLYILCHYLRCSGWCSYHNTDKPIQISGYILMFKQNKE